MQVCFTSNADGVRWAWTEGLREIALASEHEQPQADLGAPLPWPPYDVRDGQVERLLSFLHRYVARHSTPIRSGQTLRYGWTLLRAEAPGAEGGQERLILQELAAPFAQDDTTFVEGIACAVELLAMQEATIARTRITGTAEHPHRSDTILVCSHVDPSGGTLLTLSRQALTDRRFHYCGWLAGCQDRTHDHDDPDHVRGVNLSRLVARYTWIFPYLGMPAGTTIQQDGARVVVFRPDERRGYIDDTAPFILPLASPDHS